MLKKRMDGKIIAAIAISLVFLFLFSNISQGIYHAKNSQPESAGVPDTTYSDVSFLGTVSSSNVSYTGTMNVAVMFNFTNQDALNSLLNNLSNPFSPQYHKYLSASRFNSEFSPRSSVYESAQNYFRQFGLVHQEAFSNRLILTLTGTASEFSQAFHTNITSSQSGGTATYSPSSQPQLPAWLSGSVSNVIGLTSMKPHINLNLASARPYGNAAISGSSPVPVSNFQYPQMLPTQNGVQLLYGSYFQQAYNETPLLTQVMPITSVIATILWGGSYTVNGNTVNTGAFDPADIYHYFNQYLPPSQPVPKVLGVPINGAVAPGTSAQNDTTGAAIENTLDLELLGSVAPGAQIYNVYGPNSTFADLTASFNTILSPPAAYYELNSVSVISNSWGSNDTLSNRWNQFLQECQARGITVLGSTGDSGNNYSSSKSVSNTEYVQFPSTLAYDTYGVVAVGGTNLSVNPNTFTLASQEAWYMPSSSNNGDTLGTVGGISNLYTEPSWQLNSQANTVIKGTGRGVPDIAAVANNTLIYFTNTTKGSLYIVAGTSISAPVVAGIMAEIDQYRSQQGLGWLGFINPSIYMLGTGQYDPSLTGGYSPSLAPFFDVTAGNNAVYSALPGYDLVTGMGSINAYNFMEDLAGKKYNVSFKESGMDPANSWSVIVEGVTYQSSGAYVNMSLINGTYDYKVPVAGYNVSNPVAGQFLVHGTDVLILLQFQRGYSVNFTQTALPAGTGWSIHAWNYTESTFNSYMLLYFPNGTYNYTVEPADPNYYGSSGNFTVNGTQQSVGVTFIHGIFTVTFKEVGLPLNHNWTVSTTGQNAASINDTIVLTLYGGEYTFSIPPAGPYIANHTSITLNTNGQNRTVYLNFGYGYYITFTENGVPVGLQWTLLIADYNTSTTTTSITVEVQNGTYNFHSYYRESGNTQYVNGTVSVSGSNTTVNLDFTHSRSLSEYYLLYITLFILGLAVLIIGLIMLRKK